MESSKSLSAAITELLNRPYSERESIAIPDTENVTLKDGAVKINATFIYADLAGSSLLAKVCPWTTTSKIIRAYLDCCTRMIRSYGGEIRSFDGDRVMGIFTGDQKNSNSTFCARKIDWAVENIINPLASEKFKSINDNSIKITHCIGIDSGESHAVRAGIRGNNDLIWIGTAPSFAAKLSDIRDYPYSVFISENCYKKLNDTARSSGDNNIWLPREFIHASKKHVIYGTKTVLKP